MSEIYYIEAKTVEEAIAIANRKYSDDKHEVTTEIIALPKRGFLGIGAKDAKIKVTVTESQSSELSSLVSDMKKMKSLTNRGNEDRREDANNNRTERKQPSMKTRTETQKPQFKSAETKKSQKTDKPAQSNAQKPSQPKQTPKPAQTQPKQEKQDKPAQPKQEKPAQSQPKQEKPAQPKQEKPAQQPKPQSQQQQPKPEKQPTQPAQTPAQTQPQPQQNPDHTTDRRTPGSLNNQVKSKSRRMSMNRSTPAKEIDPSGVTVSAPVGVESFTSTTNNTPAPSGFGSFGTGTGGRMSNDIKKKSRQPVITDPGKANLDALKALTSQTAALQKAEQKQAQQSQQPAPAPKTETKPETPEKREPKDPREGRKPSRNQKRQRNTRQNTQPEPTPVTPTPKATTPAAADPAPTPPAEEKVRECVTQEEMDFALEFANTLLTNMKLDARAAQAFPTEEEMAEVKAIGEANVYPKINIVGGDTGILIGHHGETLDSIQYLINLSAIRRSKQKDGDYVKIVVDIEGYREKREETLRSLARRMASRAVKYKRNIYLEPMNAYERRIIHSELQSFENVSTHSVGSDRDRKIVITYEGADKRNYQKRERKQPDPPIAPAPSIDPILPPEPTLPEEDKQEDPRPNKPKKLPIEELDTLLESREDHNETAETEEQAEINPVESAYEPAESTTEEPKEITEEAKESPADSTEEITE